MNYYQPSSTNWPSRSPIMHELTIMRYFSTITNYQLAMTNHSCEPPVNHSCKPSLHLKGRLPNRFAEESLPQPSRLQLPTFFAPNWGPFRTRQRWEGSPDATVERRTFEMVDGWMVLGGYHGCLLYVMFKHFCGLYTFSWWLFFIWFVMETGCQMMARWWLNDG